jgi:hypothetical protein
MYVHVFVVTRSDLLPPSSLCVCARAACLALAWPLATLPGPSAGPSTGEEIQDDKVRLARTAHGRELRSDLG